MKTIAIACSVLLFIALVSAQGLCIPCQTAIGLLESVITENTTETQILEFLEQYCNLLPSPYNQACIQGIADNGPAIIQQLVNAENPMIVCQQLNLCTSAEEEVHIMDTQKVQDCQICADAVLLIESFITQQKNREPN